MISYQDKPGAMTRTYRVLVLCVTAFLFFQLISLYLSWQKQAILGAAIILVGLVANRLSTSRIVTLALMVISMSATFRYAWWRMHLLVDFFSDESNPRTGLNAAFLLLLISAEAYTIVIMVLGYMQTAWPLQRKPIPLPSDDVEWPHVDLLIPTYNEPLSLVRYTALAALNIDYPPEKLHVYILDDGTRDEFSEFAAEAGVGYVIREKHSHAKAGNINHALTQMDSPYVAIFDCDHVPTRSFLQMTLGWMLADPKLGMLQTPHHFYSPDPFERNLLQYKTIPNEAELFYGIVQDGNDFWNATFFCGSCALIRRSALDAVGGIATETVTEDAHTSLRMQRRGYNTAYINIPQAAGLATESLAAHVGQRIRWARGMIQILRTDNPLFGRGLKFTQRLCYFNAMAHFLYSVPRLVFLGAPLVYLLLGRTIIPGYWVAILAYAFPHLILSSLTNSRIQGRHRHSFWNEIYEAVLAPYILAPTLLALINPKLGKFNVTSKGSTLGQTQFDRKIATPTRWMLLLNFCGLVVAPYRLFVTDPQHPGAVIMNMVWVLFNIVILGVAAAVAHEQKQRRGTVRIEAKIPMQLIMPGGRYLNTVSIDMSVGGASIKIPSNAQFSTGDLLKVAFPSNTGKDEIRAQVIGTNGQTLRVAFQLDTIAEQEILTRALYSRADAWLDSSELKEVDRPLVSLGRVIVLSTYGIYQVCRTVFPEKRPSTKVIRAKTAALIMAGLALGTCGRAYATGESIQSSKPDPGNLSDAVVSPNSSTTNLQVISFKDMGVKSAIEMRGPHSYSALHFTLSHQLVPKQGTLDLNYSIDPNLDPQSTSLQISLNGTAITTLHPGSNPGDANGIVSVKIPVSSWLLVRSNTLTFEFVGSGVMEREQQAREHILCRLFPTSTFEAAGDWLRLGNDLSQLPLPLLDSELQSTTTIPFVFLSQPSPMTLEAAGSVASWFGVMSGSQPVRFTVSLAEIPSGNAVIFTSNRSSLPAALEVSGGSGPVIALRNNPSDPFGSLLIFAASNDADLLAMARTLTLPRRTHGADSVQGSNLTGDTAESPALIMPPVRTRDDAPRWLPVTKSAPLTSCAAEGSLQTDGSSPVPVYFHAPPDLFYGEKQNLDLHVNYRYDARLVAPGSALRVVVNGRLVGEVSLPPGQGLISHQRVVEVPVADIRPFGNTILFNFDFVPANRDAATSPVLSGEILCNSSLDLHGLALWTRMPNLGLFADAGFPFTQVADLSQTVVVLPTAPSDKEIALYLHLMSRFGSQTGYPSLRVTVTGPDSVITEGRDYLILGTIADQPAFSSLAQLLPATLDDAGVHVKPAQGLSADIASIPTISSRWWSKLLGRTEPASLSPNEGGPPDAMVGETESPASPDRSIVTIVLRQSAAADEFAGTLQDPTLSSDMSRSLSLLRNSAFKSYASNVGTYHVGDISWYATMRIYLTQYFLLLLFLVLALSFLCARYVYGWMAWRAHQRLRLADATREDD
jgi:cellulose synthase (UDP-forming)